MMAQGVQAWVVTGSQWLVSVAAGAQPQWHTAGVQWYAVVCRELLTGKP